MTEITEQEQAIDTRQMAAGLMLVAARLIDPLTIRRHLDLALPPQERARLADEIQDLIDKAEVTITFPEASGS